MASGAEPSGPLKYQTWVLKVSIHCEGCKKEVKRVLHNIEGVYTIDIDSQLNKVTVTGNVEAETLIRKLVKSGKPAELWPENKPNSPNPNPNNSGNGKNKEKPLAGTNSETATKGSCGGKKKGKKGGREAPGNSGGAPPLHPQPMYQVPVFPQPASAVSYNMAHPTASYSYYAPMPPMPQSYIYSGHPPPPENYYGQMDPTARASSSQGNYDTFGDESVNGCTVM